jgi:hypothetical protein
MTQVAVDKVASGMLEIRRELKRYAAGMGALMLALFLADGLCGTPCGTTSAWWISSFCLVALAFLSGRTVIAMLRRDVNTLWTPAMLYPLGTLLYFGFGSMSTLFSTEMTQRFLLAGNYGLDAAGLMRTMLLTTMGVTICVICMLLAMRVSFGKSGGGGRSAGLSLPTTAVFFVVAGAGLRYGLVLPNDYGLINVSVPGALKSLTGLVDLGLAVMMYMAARGSKFWLLIFLLIWPVHLGLSVLDFSKRTAMFAILLPAAGAFLGHQSWKRLLPWIVFAGLTYATVQDINTTARLTILQRTGTIGQAGFGERLNLFDQIISGEVNLSQVTSTARASAQVWWLRLNYSGAQLRAMELYDNGRPGEWTLSLAATVIPRFLWPEKPVATAQGRIFNRIVSGYQEATTRVAMSVYADGYWLMGWPGAALFSAIMGLILGLVTRITYRFVVERQLVYLPVVFMGMNMATLGPMGFLQKSFVGALPILLGYLLIIYLVQRMLGSSKAAPGGRSSGLRRAGGYAS